ncbi:MAG: Asp-tRNA(Asn)/Glu-tRNA(Gln) amidotransferase subunit GatA [Acidobacteriota bacterium]
MIHSWPATQLREASASGQLSALEVAQAFLDRIQACEPHLKAFLTVQPERVLEEAGEIDKTLGGGGDAGPLAGIPIALKDNIITRGIRTSCASKILGSFVPPYEATVVKRLRQAGALVLGKTNMDEFAMGSSTENSAYGPTRNPWDVERVPGGSSGGSAAAVAAHEAPLALGSDTGGSVRQPAAFCGVVGLKPTYGRVSRYGLVAFGSSLDQIGPLARNVGDAALLLQAIGGYDPCDSTSAPRSGQDFVSELGKEVQGLRIGMPRQWFEAGLATEVRRPVESALRRLESMGCKLEEVDLPHTRYGLAAYYIVAPAEASSNLARYDGVRYGYRSSSHQDLSEMYRATRTEGFGAEVKRRIMLGTFVLSSGYFEAYYQKAAQARQILCEDFSKAFQKVDLLVGPTTPSPPFRLGEKTANPLDMYLSDVYTVPANLVGLPALSLPCGFTPQGLPVGLQLHGPHFSEALLLRLADALEGDLSLQPPEAAIDRLAGL